MKKLHVALIAVFLFVFQAQAQGMIFTSDLQGANEVPPVTTTAWGSGVFTLNNAQDALDYTIKLNGLDLWGMLPFFKEQDNTVSAMHIHKGAAGINGPAIFNIFTDDDLTVSFGTGMITGSWDAGDSAVLGNYLTELYNVELYLNVHTFGNPGGEIRDQLHPIPVPASLLLLGSGLLGLVGIRRKK